MEMERGGEVGDSNGSSIGAAMDEESVARYFNERVEIPEELRRQFVSVVQMRRFEMTEQLASNLGLRRDDPTVLVGRLFQSLLECLARVARETPPVKDEDRGTEVADHALERFTLDECLEIGTYFGWSNSPLGDNVTLANLNRAVHQVVADPIGETINTALTQWARNGWLGRAATR